MSTPDTTVSVRKSVLIAELTKSVLVKFGKCKRNMEYAVLQDGIIVAAFPTEKAAREIYADRIVTP